MKKNHEIRVMVNEEELQIIKQKAKSLSMSASNFLRSLGLKANFIIQQ